MFVIPVRTLRLEFQLITACPEAARALTYIEAKPDVDGIQPRRIELVVERTHGFYRLALPNRSTIEGSAAHLLDAVHRFLFEQIEGEVPGAPLIHGATSRIGDVPILLVGAKGSGKTTLVLHLLARGHSIEGDEHAFIEEDTVLARPRSLRVKSGSLAFVPALADQIRRAPSIHDWNGSPIYAVSPSIAGRPWRISRMRPRHLVFLEPNHGGHSVAKPVSTEQAFIRLMSNCLLPGERRSAAVARLRRVAREAQAWEMSLGDLAGAERHLLAITRFGNTVQ